MGQINKEQKLVDMIKWLDNNYYVNRTNWRNNGIFKLHHSQFVCDTELLPLSVKINDHDVLSKNYVEFSLDFNNRTAGFETAHLLQNSRKINIVKTSIPLYEAIDFAYATLLEKINFHIQRWKDLVVKNKYEPLIKEEVQREASEEIKKIFDIDLSMISL